ncbi:MAG: nitrous oxide-stimulated promoter family protein [Deltaproteobacteria bacterium]|jgi:hypothetical protein|nr:nitrous oxide-stimulated promoter family protein [Deltaproteobacteria bacterium]MBW2520579.1 nitrous oxide-stimulated promoter family protein [Deltaproteobacteria bacterium]
MIKTLTAKEVKDLKILIQFTAVFCKANHVGIKSPFQYKKDGLNKFTPKQYAVCNECRDFLLYAIERRLRCPLETKPACKHCHIHCFKPGHREKVRQIMRFSGQHLMKRGRFDLLWHYWF